MKNPVSAVLAEKGTEVLAIAPDASVRDAVHRMNEHHIGCLLVMEGARIAGIFSERDVLVRVMSASLDPDATRVADVMTPEVITISPETPVEGAMVIITDRRCRHLPVVEGEELRGIISAGDLTRWVIRDQQDRIQDLNEYIHGPGTF